MARQRLRLVQVRKPESFDDQKTPADILANGEAGVDHQEQFEYVISQLRQVLGTADWRDNVPASLTSLANAPPYPTLSANCLSSDAVGDLVYVTGDQVMDRYQVTKADRTESAKVPSIGLLVEKESATECQVQTQGVVEGLFSGLTPGRTYFLGADGRPSLDVTTVAGTYVQRIGVALGTDVLLLGLDTFLTKRS